MLVASYFLCSGSSSIRWALECGNDYSLLYWHFVICGLYPALSGFIIYQLSSFLFKKPRVPIGMADHPTHQRAEGDRDHP
jgi:hypothetical protein